MYNLIAYSNLQPFVLPDNCILIIVVPFEQLVVLPGDMALNKWIYYCYYYLSNSSNYRGFDEE